MSPVHVSLIAPGNAGVWQTAARIAELIRTPTDLVTGQAFTLLPGLVPLAQ